MGGYTTWNLGLRYGDRFAALVPFAGSISRRERGPLTDAGARFIVPNGRNVPFFIVHGTADNMVPHQSDRRSAGIIKELKGDIIYKEIEGAGHNLGGWLRSKEKRNELFSFLAPKRRNPDPKVINHNITAPYMGRNYWIQATKTKGNANVTAQIEDGNRIVIDTKNVQGLRVFFDKDLLDISKSVTIVLNGKTLPAISPKASHSAVLQSWVGREDPALVYAHKTEIVVEGDAAAAPKSTTERKPVEEKKKPKKAKKKWL
jgi:hypothetical protein